LSEHGEHETDAPADPGEGRPAEPSEDPKPASRAPDPGSGPPEPGWYPDPDTPDGDVLRYWDGSSWSKHRSAPEGQAQAGGPPPPAAAVPADQFSTTPVSDDERRNSLAQQIQASAVRGLRVESQDRYQAILVEGQPVNHVLHAILTIFTCGLWGIVWAVLAATGGEKRHLITVDEYGNVTHQRLGKA